MNFNKDFNPGTNNTYTEVNIGTVEQYNPAATTVINNYGPRGNKKDIKDVTRPDLAPIRTEILDYVGRLRTSVTDKWKSRYEKLWEGILDLDVVAAKVYDPGKQQKTNFNRNLVANIIYYLGCYGQLEDRIYGDYNASLLTELLEVDKDHPVRAELRKSPPPEIRSRLARFLEP